MSRAEKLPRGVDRLRSGMFRARVFHEGRQYSLGSFFTLGDARAALSIARGEMARGTFVPPAERRRMVAAVTEDERQRALTVRAWSEMWLQGLAEAERSPGTTTSYRSTLKGLLHE